MAGGPGRAYRKGVTLAQLVRMFPTDEAATEWFEGIFRSDGRCCPKCGSTGTKRTKNAKPMPYWCKDCRSYFSVRTGTVMARSHISLQNWAFTIYLAVTNLKGVSSMKLHRDLGVSQKAAWYMLHRIRKAWEDNARSFGGREYRDGGVTERELKLAEKERQALIRHWEGLPSPNPDFNGKTPKDVARALVRSQCPPGSRGSRK